MPSPSLTGVAEPEPAVAPTGAPAPGPVFSVALENFDGPFDLLLTLIGRRELDITEIALSAVTDEFLGYLRALDGESELDQASEFIVVAATLLDLKIAGLLPQGEVVDAEDAALLEARDLLFARLLQYRAFKRVSAWFLDRLEAESGRHARAVRLEERFRESEPELAWTLSAAEFAALATVALAPTETPGIGVSHLHAPAVSIREQAAILVTLLRGGAPTAFRTLVAGVAERGVIVARFLAVLELYRRAAVSLEQIEPLGELTVTWTAAHWDGESLAQLGADYDG